MVLLTIYSLKWWLSKKGHKIKQIKTSIRFASTIELMKITLVEVTETSAIKRLVGSKLISKYPEMFATKVEGDLNFRILMYTIRRN